MIYLFYRTIYDIYVNTDMATICTNYCAVSRVMEENTSFRWPIIGFLIEENIF